MPEVYREFLDANLTRAFPLTDAASGLDVSGSFRLPTNLISDIFLCVPNIAGLDKTAFYISNISIRRYLLDITIGYQGVSDYIGSFRGISTTAAIHTQYDYVPAETTLGNDYDALFFGSGQITIGDASSVSNTPGSYSFDHTNAAILGSRVSAGLLNVQYIQIGSRLLTGVVKLKAGTNIDIKLVSDNDVDPPVHTVTISASLNAGANVLDLLNDDDVIDALVARYGVPIQTINGIKPTSEMNFELVEADCTKLVELPHGISIANPCARPCGDEDARVNQLLEDVGSLDLRFGQMRQAFDAHGSQLNDIMQKIVALGTAEKT
jgi:hypothetical protein